MTGTYDSILKTAKKLISTQGYTATSIRQIAEETGIGKATIYHHFKDKEEIILALLKENTAGMKSILSRVRSEIDPKRCLETAANSIMNYLYGSSEIIHIVRREVPGVRQKMQNEYLSLIKEYMEILENAISNGIEQRIFRQIDPKEGARVFMTMIQGTFASAFMSGELSLPPEKSVSLMMDIFYNGIKK